MPRKRHKPEEIVAKLRQVDVLSSQGRSVAEAIRAIGVTEVTYYRWRQEYGGLRSDQVKRMKTLEAENARLRRAVSDLTLDKMIRSEGPSSPSGPFAQPMAQRRLAACGGPAGRSTRQPRSPAERTSRCAGRPPTD
jgi:transposase-like protein